MVSRRALLRALGVSFVASAAGCNAFDGGSGSTDLYDEEQVAETSTASPTATLTPTRNAPTRTGSETPSSTVSPTPTSPTSTATLSQTPTVAEAVGTPVLSPADDTDVDEFGRAVGLSEDVALVVAEGWGAFVFEFDADEWTNTARLTPDDGDHFGGYRPSATVVDDVAVVGGPGARGDGTGAVYRFERNGGEWTQRHTFTPDKEESQNEFGRSVDADGERVVVGDANDPTPQVTWVGGAYVFASEGEEWTLESHLETGNSDVFGTAVAVDGDFVVVGAPYAEVDNVSRTGAVYVYERTDSEWVEQSRLTHDGESGDRFGQAVTVEGDTAVVGAPDEGPGSVYVFERSSGGWYQTAKLSGTSTSTSSGFGGAVALAGERAVVGAPGNEDHDAYVLKRVDGAWVRKRALIAADPVERADVGEAVALYDDSALIGAPAFRKSSQAYLFDI